MALPASLQGTLMPLELNFLTENEDITILPRYSMKKIELIGFTVPALRAMRRERLPLWVALILKSQDKCNIVPPDWLNLVYLKEKYEQELKYPHMFSDLPFNWLEMSKILLVRAHDDLPDPTHLLRSILQDLREIRLVKLRKGLNELNESHLTLTRLSHMEINEMRPFVLGVMNKMRQLHETTVEEEAEMDSDDEFE